MKTKSIVAVFASLIAIVLGIALGSVYIPPGEIFYIICNKVFGTQLPEGVRAASISILWNLRLPRALLAFIAGGALSVSGAIMQSALRNPLASSYTIGVSSGASLGACLVIFYGVSIPLLGVFSLPLIGFVFGLGTILIAIAFASRLDGQMESNTIILTGMVFSLFVNAVTTLMSALHREHIQQLIF